MRQRSKRLGGTLVIAALLGFAGLFALLTPATVRAASVTANDFSDPTPGSCATTGTGSCSVREAVIYANSNPGTTIQLLAGTYALSRGIGFTPTMQPQSWNNSLLLTTGTTIFGAGASSTTIDASSSGLVGGAVLENASVGSVIRGVTITGGAGNYSVTPSGGGGIVNDTGASLAVMDSRITNNSSGSHGVVFNNSTMTVTNTTIDGNQTYTHAVGGDASGVIGNGGTFTLIASSIQNNTSTGGGGGVGGIETGGTMTISGSTISGNSARATSFIGFATGGILNNGTLIITNSTISGNTASSAGTGGSPSAVGGIKNGPSSLTLNSVTVAGNTSNGGTDGVYNGTYSGASITLTGTLLANTGSNCGGTLTDNDYNLSSNASCPGFTQPHDRTNADPKLGPLASNGGPTQTHALLPGSAAIDAGGTSANGCPATDQRGITRPQGLACDIGAFEVQVIVAPAPLLHPTVVSTPGQGANAGGIPNPQPVRHGDVPTATSVPNPHPNTTTGGGMTGSATTVLPAPTATPLPAPLAQPARH